MTTLLVTHEACLRHETPPGHPESAARLAGVLKALQGEAFAALRREEAPAATPAQLARVHPATYIRHVLDSVPREGFFRVDADTAMSPGTGDAALRAAGAVVRAVDRVCTGAVHNAFCAVRPPGHHAEPAQAMGFCFFGNAALGAEHARHAHGLGRVAVVDFDVHHGNGTQSMVHGDENLFYGSTHQMPLYPGTGAPVLADAAHNIYNIPLPAGTKGPAFRDSVSEKLLPALDRFCPELLIVSAGFDAHRDDPLAQLELVEDDFAWITRALMALAAKHCAGRLVSTLEGGYALEALAASVAAHVSVLMER